MKAGGGLRQLLGRRAFAVSPHFAHGGNAFTALGQSGQSGSRGIAQPQTPAFDAVEKLLRSQPAPKIRRSARLLQQKIGFFLRGKQVVAAVNGFVANAHFRHRAQRLAAPGQHHIRPIDQVGVDAGNGQPLAFCGLDVGAVVVQHGLRGRLRPKADDDAVHRCHALAFVAPLKGAVRKLDAHSQPQQVRPQHADLLALANAVGGHQGAGHLRIGLHVARGQNMPAGHVVEQAMVGNATQHRSHVFALFGTLVLGTHKRRIAHNKTALLGRQHLGPVHTQRVALADVGAFDQGDAGAGAAKAVGGDQVQLVVGDPQGHLRNVGGAGVDFQPVKLVNGYPALRANVEQPLALPAFAEQLVNQFVFEQAQFTVGDDQKISAAAGGVKNLERGQPVVQREQFGAAAAGGGQLGAQSIHEQRVDGAQDVALAGVVRAQFPAAGLAAEVGFMHFEHALEHGAKDGG